MDPNIHTNKPPHLIRQSWDAYFRNNAYRAPPSLSSQTNQVPLSQFGGGGAGLQRAQPDEKTIDDHLAVQAIIRSYQVSLASSESDETTLRSHELCVCVRVCAKVHSRIPTFSFVSASGFYRYVLFSFCSGYLSRKSFVIALPA